MTKHHPRGASAPVRTLVATVATALALAAATVPTAAGAHPEAPAGSDAGRTTPCTAAPGSPTVASLARTEEGTARVARSSGLTASRVASLRSDPAARVDSCGRVFFVETAVRLPAAGRRAQLAQDPSAAPGPVVAASAVPTLSSAPGAERTVFLDFDGADLSGTGWADPDDPSRARNTAAAFDLDGDATAFSSRELAEVRDIWAAVTEDFAPFDVNVTTVQPARADLVRSSVADTRFGATMVLTRGYWYRGECGCAGVAFLGSFGLSEADHDGYGTGLAFVDAFTSRSAAGGRLGLPVGHVVSHEVGHQLGLEHDGVGGEEYHFGHSDDWAPLMGGAGRGFKPQWSNGDYAGATNTEDDLGIIGRSLPVRSDDHADTAAGATPVAVGDTVTGDLGFDASRRPGGRDADAFRIAPTEPVTITVTPAARYSGVDARIRVLDRSGTVLADVDPVTRAVAGDRQDFALTGDEASTVFDPPTPGEPYTVVVSGAPTGEASGYGALGAYTLAVSGDGAGTAPVVTTGAVPRGTVGKAYDAGFLTAEGGTAPYTWSATGLPAGLAIDPATGRVSGTPAAAGTSKVTATAVDAAGRQAHATVTLVVDAASSEPPATATSFLTRTIPAARIGRPYRALIKVTVASYPADLRATGRTPAGVRIEAVQDARGNPAVRVSGRPRGAAGRYVFTLAITDADGRTVSRRFTLRLTR